MFTVKLYCLVVFSLIIIYFFTFGDGSITPLNSAESFGDFHKFSPTIRVKKNVNKEIVCQLKRMGYTILPLQKHVKLFSTYF